MPSSPVRFGAFEVDVKAGELRKNGRRVHIQDKPFQLLHALLERSGDVVTREELYRQLWPADTYVDFDRGLNNAANKLRTALGDSAEDPRFIETVGRRGYRFTGTIDTPPGLTRPDLPARAGSNGASAAPAQIVHPLARHVRSLAVLPLANLSSDPEQEYFSDGMTDLLITQLAGIQSLRVISRQSTVRYKGSQTAMPAIARELGVDALIEGTVLRSGGRVRISVQLIHGSEDCHLWRGYWERDLRDVFVVQAEIARAVADVVAATVTREEASRLARVANINPAAHDAYLKGRFCSRQRTREGLLKSVDYYRQAIAIEPGFAQAHAAMAESCGPLGYLGFQPPDVASPAMRAAATRALELEPDLVEGLSALAACEAFHEWRWRDAEAHFQRAIAVNPNYPIAHSWYGLQLEIEGRHQESLVARLRGLDLDPLWLRAQVNVGWALFMVGRRDEAVTRLRNALDLDSTFFFARQALGIIALCDRRQDEAVRHFEVIADRERGSLVHALANAGRHDEARARWLELEQQSAREYVSPVQFALAHLGLGDVSAALSAVEHGVDIRAVDLAATHVDPRFSALAGEPRFIAAARRMNLR